MGLFFLSGMPGTALSAEAPALPAYILTLTGYNAVPAQTDTDPSMTASGSAANPEVVAARSHDLAGELPFGTIVEIVGPAVAGEGCGWSATAKHIGYRVIADTMNTRYHNSLDILFSTNNQFLMSDGRTKNASVVLGTCANTLVRVVGFIDISRPSALPKTQTELAALVEKLDFTFTK